MRIHYYLVDFESVQTESLALLTQENIRVLVFVGARQRQLPFEFVATLQRYGNRVQYIRISGNGKNALDFHIAFYIGQIAATEPTSVFHIVSKDKGFDPLIQHLTSKKIGVHRVSGIADTKRSAEQKPSVDAKPSCADSSSAESLSARIPDLVRKLQGLKEAKPATLKKLANTIASLYRRELSSTQVETLLHSLISSGDLEIHGSRVQYTGRLTNSAV